MTELWLQLIWKISNILYFDKLNSFMPPSLLSRRQIIFRPNWQIQSKPITFILILPRVIKEQILPGNNQIQVVSFSHCSQFQVFFPSLPSSTILHASFFSFFLFFFFFLVCNKKNRKDGSSAAVAERLWRCMVYSLPFLCGFGHLMSSCLPVLSLVMTNDADYLMEYFRVPKLSAGQLLLLSKVGNSLWNATFSLFPDLFCVSSKLVQLSATIHCLQWAY